MDDLQFSLDNLNIEYSFNDMFRDIGVKVGTIDDVSNDSDINSVISSIRVITTYYDNDKDIYWSDIVIHEKPYVLISKYVKNYIYHIINMMHDIIYWKTSSYELFNIVKSCS